MSGTDDDPSTPEPAAIPRSYLANGGDENATFGGRRPMRADDGEALASLQDSARTILVTETRSCPMPGVISASHIGSATMTMTNHLGTTNWLFADGHVKALRPTATGTPFNMWLSDNSAGAPAPTGAGSLSENLETTQRLYFQ